MAEPTRQFMKRQKASTHDPKRPRDVSGMKYVLQKRVGANYLAAVNNAGQEVSRMQWDSKSGRVSHLSTHPEYQGLGIATNLWNEAHRLAEVRGDFKAPEHSEDRTNAGDKWASAVGGNKPELNKSAGSRVMDMQEEMGK